MIDMSRYEGLTNDGKWRGTSADDSVIFEVHDEHGGVVGFKTIALVMRYSDHYGTEDNPDIRLMVDAPLLLAEVKRLRKLEDVVREAFSEDSKYASGEYMNIMGEILGVIER